MMIMKGSRVVFVSDSLRLSLLCSGSKVKITFSYSNVHDTTESILEISEVRLQQPECRVTLPLYV